MPANLKNLAANLKNLVANNRRMPAILFVYQLKINLLCLY
jgi:hypothetical protein